MRSGLVSDIERYLLPNPPQRIGVAVSGGSDSLALLYLLSEFAAAHSVTISAVTVDHGLRPEAAAEAGAVAEICAGLGVAHDIRHWKGWDGRGNVQDKARTARYALMTQWARTRGIGTVALGHTQDDQAETVLMRLARGSGVDGLSAMSPRRTVDGITWLRPLLDLRREMLRQDLNRRGVSWAEDPGNTDLRYDRIKARKALVALEPLGLDVPDLAQVAKRMALARQALNWQTFIDARRMVRTDAGAVVIDWKAYRALPEEIARRMLVQAIRWIRSTPYPPRHAAVTSMIEALRKGSGGTADGCHARRSQGLIWVFREYNAVRGTSSPPDRLWDGRWRVIGPRVENDLAVRALGADGLAQCSSWRETDRPHAVLMSSPAVWSGERLIAAPLANRAEGWRVELDEDEEAYFAGLLSH